MLTNMFFFYLLLHFRKKEHTSVVTLEAFSCLCLNQIVTQDIQVCFGEKKQENAFCHMWSSPKSIK